MTGMPQASSEAVPTSLINELDAMSAGIVLVLDDYQFIDNQTVHEQVTFLLEHCPESLHVVLVTCSDQAVRDPNLDQRFSDATDF